MILDGFQGCVNPFGVLFNPSSIASAISRTIEKRPFVMEEVIERAPLSPRAKEDRRQGRDLGYVSFHHHGSFTRMTPQEFLEDANIALEKAHEAFLEADTVLVTFGTSWVFRYVGPIHIYKDIVVANCHKHPSGEFVREMLSIEEIISLYSPLLKSTQQDSPEYGKSKKWIFTVSPIRHLADGLNGNQISKATLLLAEHHLVRSNENAIYFPSFEIMIDELRDYSWYASDKVHPSPEAVDFIYSRFIECTK